LRRARVCTRPGHGRVGLRGIYDPYLQRNGQDLKTRQRLANQHDKGKWESTYQLADEKDGEHPERRVVVPAGPEVNGASRSGERVLPREEARHQL
jgi:hypothetical protein